MKSGRHPHVRLNCLAVKIRDLQFFLDTDCDGADCVNDHGNIHRDTGVMIFSLFTLLIFHLFLSNVWDQNLLFLALTPPSQPHRQMPTSAPSQYTGIA